MCACPNRVSHKPRDNATDDSQFLAMTEFPNWRYSEPFPLHIQIDYLSHRKSIFAFCLCYIGLLLLFGHWVVWVDSHFWVLTSDGMQMASLQYLVTWGGTHRCCSALAVPRGNVSVLLSSMPTSAPAAWTSVQTHVQKIPLWVFIQKFCSFRLCILTLGSTLSWVLYVGFTLLCGYLVFPT